MSFNFQGRFILMFLHFSLGISCGMILEGLWPFSHSPQPVLSILQKNQNHLKIKEITVKQMPAILHLWLLGILWKCAHFILQIENLFWLLTLHGHDGYMLVYLLSPKESKNIKSEGK